MTKIPLWRRHDRLRGPDPERDVDDELAFHIEQRAEALRRAGRSDREAYDEAVTRFGDIQGTRRAYVAMASRRSARAHAVAWLAAWVADLRYAVRGFGRTPGFAASVVLVAGVGIAVNCAVFTVLNALLLRPLPVGNPREIVRVYTSESGTGPTALYGASSYPDYADLQQVAALEGLAAYLPLAANIHIDGHVVRAEGRLVSANFFSVLAVAAARGRLITPADRSADAPPAVLSHAFWTTAMRADPSIVGSTLQLNATTVRVIGVASSAFTGIEPAAVDVYLPLESATAVTPGFNVTNDRAARMLKLVGRLAPGVSERRASEELNAVMRRLGEAYPRTHQGRQITVRRAESLIDATAAGVSLAPVVTMVFGVSGTLLVIAIVNVAALVLARTAARRRELAVRLSLGASRGRIARQLLTEGLVLAVAAEIVALTVIAALPLVSRAFGVPGTLQVGLDPRVLAFASIVTAGTAIGFSLLPALRGARRDLQEELRESHGTQPLSRARAQRTLVVVQVALSVLLLGTAALLVQSLRRQYEISPGFEVQGVLALEFESNTGSSGREEERMFAAEALPRALALPGVAAASVTTAAPLSSDGMSMTIRIPGYDPPSGDDLEVPFVYAGPDYCAALGLPLLRGEELRADTARGKRVVLVNETMAKLFWQGKDPVGATMRLGGSRGTEVTVAGIVADARLISLSLPAGPRFIVQGESGGTAVLLRTHTAAAMLKPVVERHFAAGVQHFVLRRSRSMDEVIADSLTTAKALAAVVGGLSIVALVLAISGLYAVVSYLAAQRKREFGIRLALGARTEDVLRLVVASGTRLAVVGIIIGLALGALTNAALQGFVFAISPLETATLLAAAMLAGAATLCGTLVPALRASRLSPGAIFRAE